MNVKTFILNSEHHLMRQKDLDGEVENILETETYKMSD